MDAAAALAVIKRHADYERFKARLVDLAHQESPESDLMEAEPKLLAFIREWVAPQLPALGFHDVQIDAMGNLIAHAGGERSPRSLLLLCHAMNHAPEGMPNPYSGAVIDGTPYGITGECVWGRGLAEQKSSLAAVLGALDLLKRAGVTPGGTLVFGLSTAGECGRHDSVAHMVEKAGMKAEAGILCGSTENKLGLGNKGRFDMWITVHGQASHLSLPGLGKNAIQGARRVMEIIDGIRIPEAETHPVLGQPTLTVHTIVSEPFFTHTIPSACRIAVDRRILPGYDLFQVYDELAARIPEAVDGFRVTKEMGPFQYPSEVAKDSPIVQALSGAFAAVTGSEPAYFYKHGALDGGYFNTKMGMPMVMFGSGEPRFAHTDREMVEVKKAYEAMQVYAQTVLMYLN